MSVGFKIEDGQFVFFDGSRVVATTEGTLVNFLPDDESYSFSAAFPDVNKERIDFWDWFSDDSPGSGYAWGCTGIAAVGAQPQEWTNTIDLGAAPAGADIFFGRISVNRSSGPSHSWNGQVIYAPPNNGLWAPLNGSVLLEQALGFARALSVYIADGTAENPGPAGHLVCHMQQSVSVRPGGFRTWGDAGPTAGDSAGGENRYTSVGGILVYSPTTSPGRKITSGTAANLVLVNYRANKWDGPNPPTYSDPTNFASTYSVVVQGRFGRRS